MSLCLLFFLLLDFLHGHCPGWAWGANEKLRLKITHFVLNFYANFFANFYAIFLFIEFLAKTIVWAGLEPGPSGESRVE